MGERPEDSLEPTELFLRVQERRQLLGRLAQAGLGADADGRASAHASERADEEAAGNRAKEKPLSARGATSPEISFFCHSEAEEELKHRSLDPSSTYLFRVTSQALTPFLCGESAANSAGSGGNLVCSLFVIAQQRRESHVPTELPPGDCIGSFPLVQGRE